MNEDGLIDSCVARGLKLHFQEGIDSIQAAGIVEGSCN
jgi:hypothetical protein